MSTHAHVVASADRLEQISKMMQSVGLRYAAHFNRQYARIGPLWNERFRALELADEQYALACLRYVDLNPVRAGICDDPETYQWCSYSAHAYGLWPTWLKPHPVYLSLAMTDAKRQLAYRSLCAQPLSAEHTAALRGNRLYPASDAEEH
jgi:putative transposase